MLNLIEVSRQLIQYILPTEIVLETIGNFTNIFIFTRKTLRSFNCSLCFLCSSIVSLLLLYPTCIIDLIKNNYFIDIVSTSFNVGLRQLSNLRNARYAVGILTLFSFIICIHYLIYFEIDHNGIYVSRAGFYTQFNIIFANVVYSYIPPSFLLIFGFLILLNVKQNRRRILPIVQSQQQRTNIELMKMLIIQVFVCFICVIPISIFYTVSTFFIPKLSEQMILILTITQILFYFYYCSSFYVYTLSSKLYRNELKKLFRYINHRKNHLLSMKQKNNRQYTSTNRNPVFTRTTV